MLTSVLMSVKVLQTVALSALVPFASIVHISTPMAAKLFFKETLAPKFWLGSALITVGVALTMLH